MPKKPTRRQQADATRTKIILTLLLLLETKEIQDVTVRELAKTAGISVGTFYIYFPSKEAALLYVYRTLDETFEDLALPGSPQENLRAILNAYLGLANTDSLPLLRKVYIAHLSHYDEYFFSEQRPLFKLIRAQVAPLRRGEDATKLTWKILDYCRGCFYNLCIRPAPANMNAWRAEVLADLMRGFEQ